MNEQIKAKNTLHTVSLIFISVVATIGIQRTP